jgi:NAD(P)-dependent dehydrogenase (short-subunit alcohol dehydrogenase family)
MTADSSQEFVKEQISCTPLGRLGSVNDVANAILFLASPMSSFMTGQIIVVDGGHSLR